MAKLDYSTEVITPDMAKEYLTRNTMNRKPKKGIIAYYARMMSEGKWMLNGEGIIFDNEGILLDGQHRLMACIKANVPFQSLVVRNVDTESFSTIDQGAKRTSGDNFSIKSIPNAFAISAAIRKFLIMNRVDVGSISSTRTSNDPSGLRIASAQEHIDAYKVNSEFWQDEYSFGSSCYSRCRLLPSTDVMAISAFLQLTLGYNAEVVHDFFTQVFYEECTENSTLAVFRRMVVNDAMSARGVRMTTKYKTQLLIKCWEAFKKNKQYKVLRWVKEIEGEYVFE